MKVSKVKDIFVDWVKGGFRFGKTFSNFIGEKLEIYSDAGRKGLGVFDVAAGAAITWMGGMSALGTVIGAGIAVTALTAAPVTALATIVTAPIWLALSTVMTGIGLGLLDAGREKFGISRDIGGIGSTAKKIGEGTSNAVGSLFKQGKKLAGEFKASAKAQEAKTTEQKAKPASPKSGNDFIA